MKKLKRCLSVILCLTLILSAVPLGLFTTATAATVAKSGSCGKNVNYTLDSDGTLTISGCGAMNNYSYNANLQTPWLPDCTLIRKVLIKSGVTSIGSGAFYNCEALTDITIPDSVTSIGSQAFYNCTGLSDIKGAINVTDIGSYAFLNTSFYNLHDDGMIYVGKVAYTYKGTMPENTKIVLEENTTGIAGSAFQGRKALTSITIPNSVTSIGTWAFYGCTGLSDIKGAVNVTDIGSYAFLNTSFYNLHDDGMIYVGKVAYTYKGTMPENTIIDLKDNTIGIGGSAFENCRGLKAITIPESVKSMGDYAFFGCSNLNSLTIPDSVIHIGYRSIDGEDIYYLGNREQWKKISIGTNEEYGTLFWDRNIVIHYINGESSGIMSYHNEYDLQWELDINGKLVFSGDGYIPEPKFETTSFGCYGDDYGDGKEYWYGFHMGDEIKRPWDKDSVKSITISPGITKIGFGAFANYKNLKRVDIPDSVTEILSAAFLGCSNLQTIDIPDSVSEIGDVAFGYCSKLSSVTLSNNLNELSFGLFFSCNKLNWITIPDSITEIGKECFANCTSLTTVTIPRSVKTIDNFAFYQCNNLAEVQYAGTKKEWKNITIGEYNQSLQNATLQCSSTPATPGDINPFNINYSIEKNTGETTLQFKQSWFADDSIEYKHELAQFCAKLMMLGYSDKDTIKQMLLGLGFDANSDEITKIELKQPRSSVNYYYSSKDITVNEETEKLVIIGFIGSHRNQWFDNFDPGTGKIHKGFAGAAAKMYKILSNYINSLNTPKEKTNILIFGHSRGAAVANLVAIDLINNKDKKNLASIDKIYTYTFATPSYVYTPKESADKYTQIFNIINPEDFVPKVLPVDWNYNKYGTNYVLPTKTNDTKWDKYIYSRVRKTYSKLKKNAEFPASRNGDTNIVNTISYMAEYLKNVNGLYNKNIDFEGRKSFAYTDLVRAYLYTKYINKPLFAILQETVLNLLADKTFYNRFKEELKDLKITAENINHIDNFARFIFSGLGIGIILNITNNSLDLAKVDINNYLDTKDLIKRPSFELTKACVLAILDVLLKELVKVGGAHEAQTYAAYMEALTKEEVQNQKKRGTSKSYFRCPVDIEVIDKSTGDIVARIVNNTIDEEIAEEYNALVVSVNGDEKLVIMPSDGDYEIRITGNDNGVMDYSVEEYDASGSEISRVNYFSVPVKKNVSMMPETIEDEDGNTHSAIINEFGEEIGEAKGVTPEEYNALTVSADIEGIGDVYGTGDYTIGDYITLTAETDENNSFLGFYEDGKLITKEAEYSFVIKDNRNLTAKFTDVFITATGIKISEDLQKEYVLEKDETVFIAEANIIPSNATDKQIFWTSSDESIAEISEGSVVSLLKSGKVTLTAKTADGKFKDSINITVSTHNLTKIEAKAATCTEPGNVEYYTCSECKKTFSDAKGTKEITDVATKATGHKLTKTEAKAATCTEPGNIEYYTCSECKKTFSDAKGTKEITDVTTKATGHNLTKTDAKPATCTESGNIEYYTCSGCKKTFSDAKGTKVITNVATKATGHKLTKTEAKAATCTEPGNIEYYTCSVCKKTFSDAKGTKEVTDVSTKATGHKFGKWTVTKKATLTENGIETRKCSECGFEETKNTEKLKPHILGDVDGNGDVLADDARLALRYSAKLEEFDDIQINAADVDGNGQVLADDARQILRYSAKLQSDFDKAG